MDKIRNQPTKEDVNRFHKRADQLILRFATSPKYVKDVILAYMYQLQQATIGVHNRKIQNTIDSNLLNIIKETYPKEFKFAIIKNEAMYGRA